MSLLGIELSDVGIRAAGQAGQPTPVLLQVDAEADLSPGCYLADKISPLAGQKAAARVIAQFDRSQTRFWHELSLKPYKIKHFKGLTPASLALHHMQQVWEAVNKAQREVDGAVVAVPGYYDKQRLSLLLGILKSLHVPALALLDMSQAALLGRAWQGQAPTAAHFYFDVHQCAFEISHLEETEVGFSRSAFSSSAAFSMQDVQRTLLNVCANTFVKEHRFDPLRKTETEQRLFDSLPDLMSALRDQSFGRIKLPRGEVAIDRASASAGLTKALAAMTELAQQALGDAGSPMATLYLSNRAALVPGLKEELEKLGFSKVLADAPGLPALGAWRFADYLERVGRPEEPHYLTTLPTDAIYPEGAETTNVSRAQTVEHGAKYTTGENGILHHEQPSHILFQGSVVPLPQEGSFALGSAIHGAGLEIKEPLETLSEEHCVITFDPTEKAYTIRNLSPHGTAVNTQTLEPEQVALLRTGDILTLGSDRLALMAVRLVDWPNGTA